MDIISILLRLNGLILNIIQVLWIYSDYTHARGDRLKFQRIQDLRIDNDITIKDISSYLGLHRDVYARYEKGIREFPIDVIIKLAKYYDCTTDYLLGVSNKRGYYEGK